MEFSKKNIIKIVIMLATLCCMIYANFFAVRMILRYGEQTYFYDKLLVANEIGGVKGLKIELEKILLTDKSPKELELAKEFTVKFQTLSDPEVFLRDKVKESKQRVNNIINFRSLAIVFMIILFALQGLIRFLKKLKSKKTIA